MSNDDEVCELEGVAPMHPNRALVAVLLTLGLASLCALIGVPLFAGLHGKDAGAFLRVMFYGVVGGLYGTWHVSRWRRKPEQRMRRLRASRDGVDLDGVRIVERRDVARALVLPATRHGTVVRIERKGLFSTAIELRVKDVAEGRAVLHALGVDAAHLATAMRIRATSRAQYRRRLWITVAGLPLTLFLTGVMIGALRLTGPIAGLVVGLPMMIVWPLLLFQFLLPAKLVVGADGVMVSWLGRTTFHPLHEIERAEVVLGDSWSSLRPIMLRLQMRDGRTVDVVAAMARRSWSEIGRTQAAAIAERINEAIEARAAKEGSVFETTALARAARPVSEWIAALRAMVDRTQTFREGAALAVEQLWRILEDADAEAERRAAAAAALAPKLDDVGRARLRVVADATAAPKLRVALQAAAEWDDPKLLDALEGLDQAAR